jgi:hypothetical protein
MHNKIQLPASKNYSRPLFTAGEVTMLRMASKIDDLSNTTQGLMNSLQRNCSSSPVRQSQDRFASIRGNSFRQHLYNNLFKGKLGKAFTSQGILDHPLEHFIIHAPEEINSIIGKNF